MRRLVLLFGFHRFVIYYKVGTKSPMTRWLQQQQRDVESQHVRILGWLGLGTHSDISSSCSVFLIHPVPVC